MTSEYKYVIKPLVKWLKQQKAKWRIDKPKHQTAETGWDIEARRKNQDLLIEAKYIRGSFLSSFSGLVCAPLANRPQRFMKKKYRSWNYGICWAIGTSYESRNIYQLIFDYFSRNFSFWQHYGKDLKMKFVFFIKSNEIKRIRWQKLLELSKKYEQTAKNRKLNERRAIAEELMSKIRKSRVL